MDMQIRPEIDNHTTKLIVGLIAVLLPFLVWLFSGESLASISASYWQPAHWPRNIFVGFLFAIGAFLLSYNGTRQKNEKWPVQMVLSKIAAVSAFCVALFPCDCECREFPKSCGGEVLPSVIGRIHYGAAAVMFTILAVFCYYFFRDSWKKKWFEARCRSAIYALCGCTILAAMIFMAIDRLTEGSLSSTRHSFTFWAETAGLVAFGAAWLTASHKMPLINNSEEKIPFFFRESESLLN